MSPTTESSMSASEKEKKLSWEIQLSYIIFFILGCGNLLPFNAFINTSAYYQSRFCGQPFEHSFESYFSMFYSFSQPIGLWFTFAYKRNFSTKFLVLAPFTTLVVILILTTIFVLITSFPAVPLFVITLFFTMIGGFCSSVLNGGLFGLSGILSSFHTSWMMSGQALVGLIISMINMLIIGIASESSDFCSNDDASADDGDCANYSTDFSAFAFFIITTVFIVLCILLFYVLLRMGFIQNAMLTRLHEGGSGRDENCPCKDDPQMMTNPIEEVSDKVKSIESSFGKESTDDNEKGKIQTMETSPTSVPAAAPANVGISQFLDIVKQTASPAFAVFFTFTMSLAVYPSIVVKIESTQQCQGHRIADDLWLPLLIILYNAGDFVGRVGAPYCRGIPLLNPKDIYVSSLLRSVISVLMLFTNIPDSQLSTFLSHDSAPIILVTMLGLTNGVIANLSMMYGSEMVPAEQASLAGVTMSFCLVCGLVVGSCLSFLATFIVIGAV